MTIYRCDRCKELMNKPCNKVRIEKGYNVYLEGDEVDFFDLCERCYGDFATFIHGDLVEEVAKKCCT